jgi:hypothetical protein
LEVDEVDWGAGGEDRRCGELLSGVLLLAGSDDDKGGFAAWIGSESEGIVSNGGPVSSAA